MRTAYSKTEQGYDVRHTRHKAGRRRQKQGIVLGLKEKQRLIQLFICIVLFAVALVGKGVFPQQMEGLKDNVLTILHSDTDFKAAFVGLGRAISDGEPMLESLGGLWIEVFGGGTVPVTSSNPCIQAPIYQQELALLTSNISQKDLLERRLGLQTSQNTAEKEDEETGATVNETAGWEERDDASQPALLEVKPQPVYTGPALPENCTMEKLALQLNKTITPVLGVISSGFGYRKHPIDGINKFHYGTDVAADVGTPVLAFADGVVEYIGESDIYGQYIKLRHNGGVTTFYAHCSKLCAKKGQKVLIGDTIAKVGESGNATGPHLHFEIRLDGIFLDPVYYIDTL